jgi:hypothetical protein
MCGESRWAEDADRCAPYIRIVLPPIENRDPGDESRDDD